MAVPIHTCELVEMFYFVSVPSRSDHLGRAAAPVGGGVKAKLRDLLCYECQRTKTNQRRPRFLMCEQCRDLCRRGAFSTETQRRWDAGETGVMLCYRHESEPGAQVSPAPGESVACTRCKEVWPENCFATEELRGLATSLRCLCWICLAEERHPESFRAKKACPGLFGFVSVNSFLLVFRCVNPKRVSGKPHKSCRHRTTRI